MLALLPLLLLQLPSTAVVAGVDESSDQINGDSADCDFAVFDSATADDVSQFERHVRQRQPTLLAGATAHWPALAKWRPFERFARRHANLQLPVRKPLTTARGQSFRRASQYITLSQWALRARPPFVFDTNGSSGILPALGADVRPLPKGLTTVLRTPIFSLTGACVSLSFPTSAEPR